MLQIIRTAVFFLLSCNAYGQVCVSVVRGTVTEHGKGMAGVSATIQNKTIFSDTLGRFVFSGLCAGSQTLTLQAEGSQAEIHLFSLGDKDTLVLGFTLHEKMLENVTVLGRKRPSATLGISTISQDDLRKRSGLTLAENLQSLTGVGLLQTGASIAKPVLHGMHSNRLLVLNNGVRQEGQQWGSEHAPEIDPFIAKNISVVKGAASVQYGSDAIAGVILVEPETIREGLHTEANLATFTNGRQGVGSVLVSNAKNGFGWRIQGTLKRGGSLSTPNYILANTALAEQNASAALTYKKNTWTSELFYSVFRTRVGIFRGAHVGSLGDLATILSKGEPLPEIRNSSFSYEIQRPYQAIRHQLLKAKVGYRLPKGGGIEVLTGFQYNFREEYDLHRPRCEGCPELEFKLKTFTTDILWEHRPIHQKITGKIGVSGFFQQNTRRFRPLIPDFTSVSGGIFLIEQFTTPTSTWELGIRYDTKHLAAFRRPRAEDSVIVTDFWFKNWSFSLGREHRIHTNTTLRYNIGSAWRAPNVSELLSRGVHHGAASYEEGNANLRLEKAWQFNLNLNWKYNKCTLETDLYLNYIGGYVYLKPLPVPILTIRGAFPAFRYTQTDALFRGIDINHNYQFTSYFAWQTKGSFLWVSDVRNGSFLVGIPPQRIENIWILSHKKMSVELSHTFVMHQNRVLDTQDFLPAPPAYHLWGLGIDLRAGKRQVFNLSCQNIFNLRYRDYMNRFRYFADESGRNIALRWKYEL